MLILKRKKNDSILIGNDIRITVLDCDNGSVSLAINAPKHISILREELTEAERSNLDALLSDTDSLRSIEKGLNSYMKKYTISLMTHKRVNTDKMTLICYTKYHIALSAAGVREKKTLSDAGKIMLFFPCGFPALLLLICLI